MDIPRDANLPYVVFKLMDRGFSEDTISRSLKGMVGDDWKEVQISLWRQRLMDKGFIFREIDDLNLFIDEIEALVHGRRKLELDR